MSSSRKLKRKTEMTIDIDKLRAAHAATTQGEWELMPPGTDECGEDKAFDYVRVAEARFITAEGTSATEAGDNSAFIALAHNEFPAMLDEIERLRAEVEAHSDRAQSLMGSEAKRFDEIERLRTQIEKLRCSGGRAEFQAELDKLYALANPKTQA